MLTASPVAWQLAYFAASEDTRKRTVETKSTLRTEHIQLARENANYSIMFNS